MNKRGFTLVEIIAVVTIMGLLALVIVPTINNTIDRQRQKTFESSVKGLFKIVQSQSESDKFNTKTFSFNENLLTECTDINQGCGDKTIKTDGKITNGTGFLKMTNTGLSSLYINDTKHCSFKTQFGDITTTTNQNLCDFGKDVVIALNSILTNYNPNFVSYKISDGNLIGLNSSSTETILGNYSNFNSGTINLASDQAMNSLSINGASICAKYNTSNGKIEFLNHSC